MQVLTVKFPRNPRRPIGFVASATADGVSLSTFDPATLDDLRAQLVAASSRVAELEQALAAAERAPAGAPEQTWAQTSTTEPPAAVSVADIRASIAAGAPARVSPLALREVVEPSWVEAGGAVHGWLVSVVAGMGAHDARTSLRILLAALELADEHGQRAAISSVAERAKLPERSVRDRAAKQLVRALRHEPDDTLTVIGWSALVADVRANYLAIAERKNRPNVDNRGRRRTPASAVA